MLLVFHAHDGINNDCCFQFDTHPTQAEPEHTELTEDIIIKEKTSKMFEAEQTWRSLNIKLEH